MMLMQEDRNDYFVLLPAAASIFLFSVHSQHFPFSIPCFFPLVHHFGSCCTYLLYIINILLSIGCTNVFWELFFFQRQGRNQGKKKGFLLLLGLASAPGPAGRELQWSLCCVLCGTDKPGLAELFWSNFSNALGINCPSSFQSQACVSHPNYVFFPSNPFLFKLLPWAVVTIFSFHYYSYGGDLLIIIA